MSEGKYRNMDRPLFLLRYLMQNTDDEHKVSLSDLAAYCETHNHGGSRHAISNDLDILCKYDFDIIVTKDGNKNFYSYGSRPLDTAELRLLMDAVMSAPFISAGNTARLTRKLASIAGNHDAEKLCASVRDSHAEKTANNRVFLSIDVLHQAITLGKKVRFRRQGKRNEIVLSPYFTQWKDNDYLVIGWSDAKCGLYAYRVDEMEIPILTDEPAVKMPIKHVV